MERMNSCNIAHNCFLIASEKKPIAALYKNFAFVLPVFSSICSRYDKKEFVRHYISIDIDLLLLSESKLTAHRVAFPIGTIVARSNRTSSSMSTFIFIINIRIHNQ